MEIPIQDQSSIINLSGLKAQRSCKKLLAYDVLMVLVGDFNVMPTVQDVYEPENWNDNALLCPEVRLAYKQLLAQGWTDVIRKIYPDEKIYTFWQYFRNAYARDAGLRIDHFLLNSDLKKCLISSGVDRNVRAWEKASDHAPVWIELSDVGNKCGKKKQRPIFTYLRT